MISSDLFREFRLKNSFYTRSELAGPWGIQFDSVPYGAFHFVAEGSLWLGWGQKWRQLKTGDFVFFPQGSAHALASNPNSKLKPIQTMDIELTGEFSAKLTVKGEGPRTLLLCGGVVLDPENHPLKGSLPEMLNLAPQISGGKSWVASVLEALESETLHPRFGSETFLTRLTEVLFLEAIRDWIDNNPESRKGWLLLAMDEQIGPMLNMIHQDAGRSWTSGNLAQEAGMSKSLLFQRFKDTLGIPPLEYVTGIRMEKAVKQLKGGRRPLAQIASESGYGSEAAFTRAFKRYTGKTPGIMRREGLGS